MTVVGKILVFLNLVFSLVVGAFAVMDYTARTQWADAYDQLKKRNDVAEKASQVYRDDSNRLAKEKETLYEQFRRQAVKLEKLKNATDMPDAGIWGVKKIEDQATTIDKLSRELDDKNRQLAAEKNRVANYQASEKSYKTDMERRQLDAGTLRTNYANEVQKNFEVTKEMTNLRDQMVQAQIRARTLEDHNKRLVTRVTELERLKGSGGVARGRNTPPENVEGLVRRADGNLVTISLGSDAGLAQGQTLEVFRLGQQAKYIGRIRIVDVTANQAVGQVTGRLTGGPIQVGDRVASKIVGGG